MLVQKRLVLAAGATLVLATVGMAKPSTALVSFTQQAAASSITPAAGVVSVPVSDEPVNPPTMSTITPNVPNTVHLMPITIRPPFRPEIRSPFTP